MNLSLHVAIFVLLPLFCLGKSLSCNESLGLRRGKIKDTQITGKGEAAGTFPYQAKYDSTGWCVDRVDSQSSSFSVDYYLQVDFLEVKKISGILLRGIEKPKGFTYGPRVKLEYKIRPDESYKEKILQTSNLKYPESEYIKIYPAIHVRYIKYFPLVDQNAKCVSLDFLGCPIHACNYPVLKKSMEYTESSFYSSNSGQNFLGRFISASERSFAWGPDVNKKIFSPYQEFVQVDLMDKYVINGLQIFQAMYIMTPKNMPKVFIVAYRNGNSTWSNITSTDNKLMEFDTTKDLSRMLKIQPAFVATQIKILPKIESTKAVFLKLQLFGCLFRDAFRPQVRPVTTIATTIGTSASGRTKGVSKPWTKPKLDPAVIKYYEIRQGVRYQDINYDGKVKKGVLHEGKGELVDGNRGYQTFRPIDWVGWRKSLLPTPYMIITLEKATSLNSIELVGYVDGDKRIGLFSSCTVQFSGSEPDPWSEERNACPYTSRPTGATTVNINFMQRVAVRIRMTFNYSDEWMVFSEVTLNKDSKKGQSLDLSEKLCRISTFTKTTKTKPDSDSTGLILAIVIPLVLVLIILIILAYKYRKKIQMWILLTKVNKGKKEEVFVSYSKDDGVAEHIYTETIDKKDLDAKRPFLNANVPSSKISTSDTNMDDEVLYAAPDQNLLTEDQGPVGYIEVAVDPGQLSPVPNYAEPDTKPDPDDVELNPIYAGTQIYEDPYQTVTGSSLYADPHVEKERLSIEIKKFPREKLRFLEKIGEGQFGEVHICEVDALGSFMSSDTDCSWRMTNTVQVAVKLLKSGVEKMVESEFMKEVRVMARLKHENVVQLLGVCDEEPKCMVVEYMENGDLNQFLKNYTKSGSGRRQQTLNEDTLLHICMQIAAGMNYLASQGFIHRDLATRNCLVGHSYTVKISDFGMSRYLYSKQYYRIEGKAVLPIRWMAPESLFYGTFTSQTDIWAFAVTIWEVFTFANETPYAHLTDQQVIDNACSVVAKQRKAFKCLPQPESCANDVYEILLQCWQRSADDRPCFEELYKFFLSRSNTVEASI